MKGGPLLDDVRAQLAACSAEEHAILTLLAIAGEPMGRQRILEHMRALNAPLPAAQWADELARLGDEVTVKRLMSQRGHIELHPANPDFQPIVVGPNDAFEIEGVMVGLIRDLG